MAACKRMAMHCGTFLRQRSAELYMAYPADGDALQSFPRQKSPNSAWQRASERPRTVVRSQGAESPEIYMVACKRTVTHYHRSQGAS